uniref:autotransporter outer membrane beta-barrel domain-containing protein n=1 Tax=Parendozoicomonas sp. Alg238-R29 TaxID=2993446 RepID=UPI00248E3AED
DQNRWAAMKDEARRELKKQEEQDAQKLASHDDDSGEGVGRLNRRRESSTDNTVEGNSGSKEGGSSPSPEIPPQGDSNNHYASHDDDGTGSLQGQVTSGDSGRSEVTQVAGNDAKPQTQPQPVAPVVNKPAFDSALVAALPATAAEASSNAAMQMFAGHHRVISDFRKGRAKSADSAIERVDAGAVEALVKGGLKDSLQPGGVYSYVRTYGHRGSAKMSSGLPGYSNSGYGFDIGAFKALDTELLVGVMFSAENNKTSPKGKGGSTDMTSLRVGPFFSWKRDNFHIDGALTAGHHDVRAKGKDKISGDSYKGNFTMNDWAAWIGTGYDIHLDELVPGLTLTPIAEFMYIDSRQSGFDLKSQHTDKVKVKGGSRHGRIDRYGLMMDYQVSDSQYLTSIHGGVGVQMNHFADNKTTMTHVESGNSVTEKREQRDRKLQWYTLGVNSQFSDYRSLSFDLEGTRGRESHTYGASLTFEKKF